MALGPDDYTTPSLDSPVTEGMGRVRVHRVTYTENTARETVPYETEYLDETAEAGKYSHEVLVQAGQDGLVDVPTARSMWTADIPAPRWWIPGRHRDDTGNLPEIQFRRRQPAAGPQGHHGGKQRAQQLQQNVFHEGDRLLFRPRTRRKRPGPILRYFPCDPTLIPYGTRGYITSADGKFVYGWAIATDTGAFVQSNRMQVYLFDKTYAESVANGVKYVNVYVP
ncbi:MAG: 3D domain-containing protein [Ruthenibacterium lactatiformans]